jgi:hypothetical protein
MGVLSTNGASRAISSIPGNGNDSAFTPGNGSDDDWFANAARTVLGKDAGLHLHHITGFPESSCYAYAAKKSESRRHPSGQFLRTLIRGDHGEPFLFALMDGCTARWWTELAERKRCADAYEAARK